MFEKLMDLGLDLSRKSCETRGHACFWLGHHRLMMRFSDQGRAEFNRGDV